MAVAGTCKIQIMSDLHLETHPSYDYDFPQTAPHLALLGDIGHVVNEQLIQFLTRFDLTEEITVLGCTLFSHVATEQAMAVQSRLVDFRDILSWDVGDHVDAHLEDLQWLNLLVSELAQQGRKIIIFTHHSPTTDQRARNPRFAISDVSTGFATDLSKEECWTNPAVSIWAFGHTHYSCDFTTDHGKRVVANQKGYYLIPQKAFQSGKVIEVAGAMSSHTIASQDN
ncbi:hypothetical protein AMS68_007936 [Peltaster fructicola]|uniref:Calcineurin-like phosphoesterase domain-containing protein n=1 Tax=Peltaster fructicola TaxID=286661 RepID=A0A6H0Y6G7_9PEZI|nr:hypothetical protein AMS68_007936 [Peltaster fructicola]